MQLKQRGFIYRHVSHFLLKTTLQCKQMRESGPGKRLTESLGLQDTLTAYFTLIIGHIASLVVLVGEMMYEKMNSMNAIPRVFKMYLFLK